MTDLVTRLVDWYNNPLHMSLENCKETPAQVYMCKQAPYDILPGEMEMDSPARA